MRLVSLISSASLFCCFLTFALPSSQESSSSSPPASSNLPRPHYHHLNGFSEGIHGHNENGNKRNSALATRVEPAVIHRTRHFAWHIFRAGFSPAFDLAELLTEVLIDLRTHGGSPDDEIPTPYRLDSPGIDRLRFALSMSPTTPRRMTYGDVIQEVTNLIVLLGARMPYDWVLECYGTIYDTETNTLVGQFVLSDS